MVQHTFTITDELGIHARPATQLVTVATKYHSELALIYKEKSVNLKSIMGLLSLGIGKGAEITITAEGSDEVEALDGVSEVIKGGLGE
ncbi:phosphocarrier protein HPr [Bacillus sp. HMF5848]|uniref:phosphocarrier protein HPr n=1 Tax=Bacillus sp. HMF5848 TaxID=2495421 RepID=UPI000F7863D1|nr:phosphocarrier protein HPr [Bacillus sp. HMF5848]RSK25886.1 phosphocarrier protein HPr [Bacillus sp. HMF5848]